MNAPDQSFADAIDVFLQRYPEYECRFLARVRQCKNVPKARTPNDYVELAGSLYVAWSVAHQWPTRPEVIQRFQQAMIPTRNAIRALLKVDKGLDSLVRQYLERREQWYASLANYSGETLLFEGFEGPGLPKRRDHLTFAGLGRKRRGAGPLLFVREVSAAIRAIFGKPYYKVVGQLAGLAFGIKTLSRDTVRTMCKKKPVQFKPRKGAN
jgi:hypothetical protein